MRSKVLSICPLFLGLLLSSCTPPPLGPDVDWDNGARRAWIVERYVPQQQRGVLPECIARLSEADLAARRFVKVRYHHNRLSLVRIAELPPSMQVEPDDQVEVWPEDCAAGKISRISRVLSRK